MTAPKVHVVHQKGLPCRYLCKNRQRGYVWREGRENAIEFDDLDQARKAVKAVIDIKRVWISDSISLRENG